MESVAMHSIAESMNDELYHPGLMAPIDPNPLMAYEEVSETLRLDEVELRLDFNLGDDDLEVSLLVESLEQQYQDMLAAANESDDTFLSLQSAKEWVSANRDRMAGLFRYLKSLSDEQL